MAAICPLHIEQNVTVIYSEIKLERLETNAACSGWMALPSTTAVNIVQDEIIWHEITPPPTPQALGNKKRLLSGEDQGSWVVGIYTH